MKPAGAPPLRWAALIGAPLLAPVTVRVALLVDHSLVPGFADARGFLADNAVALLLATGIAVLANAPPWARWCGVLATGLWSLVHFANYEHISELGSVINILNAGFVADATFLRGSVMAPTHPFLAILTTLASAVLAWFALRGDGRYRPVPLLLVAISLVVAVALWPTTTELSIWRQSDVVTIQVERLVKRAALSGGSAGFGGRGLAERDLSGAPILASGPRGENVLLVILEGVSGAYLPSLREVHGASSSLTMPGLDGVAGKGLAYPSFISTQRQTSRGEYALLCGDYPKLLTRESHMTELAGTGPVDCLPATMRDAGFATAYLQAAPLPFMLKDQFMTQAGFDEVHGNAWFTRAYNRNHWGVDDRAFFERSLDLIDELNDRSRPWFLTLLTVGTHHRYNVPPDFEGESEQGSAEWAFEYLDQAIGAFVSRLESAGVLEDTLVLITSDESQAMEVGASDARNSLTQGWGFLIALTPAGDRGLVREVFAQPDLPISVLDYLQTEAPRRQFTGRSVFRRYQRPRELFWGNTHFDLVSGLSADSLITICREEFDVCGTFPVDPTRIFSPEMEMRAATGTEIEWLRDAALASLTTTTHAPQSRSFSLISLERHPILVTSSEQYVFGGQFITVPAHSRADVEIEVELHGASGSVVFAHNLIVGMQPRLAWNETLEVGQTLRLNYTVGAESALEDLECRFWITGFDGEDLQLAFRSAVLTVVPLAPSAPAPETTVHTFEITRASDGAGVSEESLR